MKKNIVIVILIILLVSVSGYLVYDKFIVEDNQLIDNNTKVENDNNTEVESDNNIVVVYSNLDEKTNVKKGQEIVEGQVLGTVGDTTSVESEDGAHIHVEAFKGEESIDPMTLLK